MTNRDACRAPQTSILAQHEADETRSGSGDGLPVGAYVTRGQSIKREKGSRKKGRGAMWVGWVVREKEGPTQDTIRETDRDVRVREIINREVEEVGSGRVKGPQEEEREEEEATHGKKGGANQ